jgi:hypothetical protein
VSLVASYNVKVTVRPSADARPEDPVPEPLEIAQLTAAFEEAVRRVYWDAEPGGQSVGVHVTAERTDI